MLFSEEGSSVVLPRRTAAARLLRVGTLSWNLRRDEEPQQSVEDFLGSLMTACQDHAECDVVASSGKTVEPCPSPERVLAASGEIPVVFEAVTDEGGCSWFVAYLHEGIPVLTLLRREQLVIRFNDWQAFPHLVEVIASGAGVIRFEDSSLKLVLFVCGENNVPQSKSMTCLLQGTPDELQENGNLGRVLGGEWVMLNPSHRPYWPQIGLTGFLKVGTRTRQNGQVIGPTLQKLVRGNIYFRDRPRSPIAVIHANNFHLEQPETIPYASVIFGDSETRVRQIGGPTLKAAEEAGDAQGAPWRYSVYELQEGPRQAE